MWYPSTIIDDAAYEPLTLNDVKSQCIIEHDDDDDLIARLIAVARDYVEKYCGTPLAERTVVLKCDGFADFARLPEAPVQSVSSIVFVDGAGANQTVGAEFYELRADDLEASINLNFGKSWPSIQRGSRVLVTADVGYLDPPPAVLHAMLMLISHWYANREAVVDGSSMTEVPIGVESLLCNFRRNA